MENINEKFKEFKAQIETELKTLETQKSFYEDKYLKLFEIASKQLLNNEESRKVKKTIQNGTQTDLQQKNLKTELTHNKNVFVYKEISEETHSEDENNLVKTEEFIKNESNVSIPNIEEKLVKFEENIENKVIIVQNIYIMIIFYLLIRFQQHSIILKRKCKLFGINYRKYNKLQQRKR